MKKVLVLLMLAGLILFPAVSARASVNVYAESMFNFGDYDGKAISDAANEDLGLFIGGVEFCSAFWKVGIEGGIGDYADLDYSFYDFKIGYKLAESDYLKLDLTASYASVDDTDSIAGKTKGVSLGTDLILIFGEKATAELALAYAIDPDNEDGAYSAAAKDVNMYAAKLRFNYMLDRNWGVYAGYRYRKIELKNSGLTLLESEAKGPVLGVNYRF
jgi:hypothetical protein